MQNVLFTDIEHLNIIFLKSVCCSRGWSKGLDIQTISWLEGKSSYLQLLCLEIQLNKTVSTTETH